MANLHAGFAFTGVRKARQANGALNTDIVGRSALDHGRIIPTYGGESGVSAYTPEAFPWPFAADDQGISYPAGTVGIRMNPGLIDSQMIAVPGSLPGGYTMVNDTGLQCGGMFTDSVFPISVRPRLFLNGEFNVNYTGQAVYGCIGGSTSDIATVTTMGGFSVNGVSTSPTVQTLPWSRFFKSANEIWTPNCGPMNMGQATLQRGDNGAFVNVGGAVVNKLIDRIWIPPHVGFRNWQYGWFSQFDHPSELRFTVTRNADWSQGTDNAVAGTTPMFTFTLGSGDFAFISGLWRFTGPITGIAQPPLGTLGSYHVEIRASMPALSYVQGFALSPRVDIPLPWTIVGASNLIVPGGYSSVAAAPAGGSMIALTGADQAVSKMTDGDGTVMYGYMDLSPGSHTFQSSQLMTSATAYGDEQGLTSVGGLFGLALTYTFTAATAKRYYFRWQYSAATTANVKIT